MHEICHGLGPAVRAAGAARQVDIREAMAGSFSGLEEAKADVVGMFALKWLVDKGAPEKRSGSRNTTRPTSAGNLPHRAVRHGAEAHGRRPR